MLSKVFHRDGGGTDMVHGPWYGPESAIINTTNRPGPIISPDKGRVQVIILLIVGLWKGPALELAVVSTGGAADIA